MSARTRAILAILACAGAGLRAAAPSREVDVVVDLTPEGRKIAPPSREHPAFYYPVVGGYRAMGALVAGEKPPVAKDVVHLVAVELANQGYLVVSKQHAQPDLILAVHWGYLNAQIDNIGPDPSDPTTQVFFNQEQMLALVAGHAVNNLDLPIEREDVMQAAEVDRYFVMLTAYDAGAYLRRHQRIKLWQAKMSVPSNGVHFDNVMGALVKAGGPFLGRETTRPKMLLAPITPDGRVEVGTPTVQDYLDAPSIRTTSTPASK